jgi:hypothetical protein
VQTLAEVHGWTVSVDRSYRDGFRLQVGNVSVERTDPATT